MSSSEDSSFKIRDYQPADFPHLCDLDRICFPEAIAYSPEEIAMALSQRGVIALVAEAQNGVVGFVLAHQRRRLGHVITIDVQPDFRGKGVGAKLMRLSEERMQLNGAARIVLEVSVSNENAIRFYHGLGYVTRRLLPGYYPDSSDALLMEKTLV